MECRSLSALANPRCPSNRSAQPRVVSSLPRSHPQFWNPITSINGAACAHDSNTLIKFLMSFGSVVSAKDFVRQDCPLPNNQHDKNPGACAQTTRKTLIASSGTERPFCWPRIRPARLPIAVRMKRKWKNGKMPWRFTRRGAARMKTSSESPFE